VSDGTSAGTFMVKDIFPGSSGSLPNNDDSYFYTKYAFFFIADNGINGTELWKTDGTLAGTAMVSDLYPGTISSAVEFFGVAEATNRLLFRSTDASGADINALTTAVVPFPLSLTDFIAQIKNERPELRWTTQQEVNVSHFNIQRSIVGTAFMTIGKVAAQGGISTNNYTYTDERLNKSGTYYYRLEMIDNDGKKTYSNIVSVKMNSGFNFSLATTKNQVMLNVGEIDGAVTIRLIDINGKVYLQQKQKLVKGETVTLPTTNLSSGIYLISVEHDGMIKTERFFK
jgi:ELWxxDGT repeat protein